MTVTPLFREGPSSVPADGVTLGPGVVTEVGPAGLMVDVAGIGIVRARLAVAFPYEPRVDDDVLVIGRADGRYWLIGVERSTGPASLSVHGDLEPHPPVANRRAQSKAKSHDRCGSIFQQKERACAAYAKRAIHRLEDHPQDIVQRVVRNEQIGDFVEPLRQGCFR